MSARPDFWARRRAGVAAEARAEEDAAQAQVLVEEQAKLEDMSEAEMLIALELPDPDTLGKGDDFTVFMTQIVPDQIRRRALRALWRSNPVLANVDMLVDYGEDFTDSATVIANMQTTYQVGKGMLKHVEEMARQAAARAEQSETDMVDDENENDVEEEALIADAGSADPVFGDPAIEDQHADVAQVADMPNHSEDAGEDYSVPAPRRMRFEFEETA